MATDEPPAPGAAGAADQLTAPVIPSLFNKDLPPCNAPVQVAFENVIDALRTRFLSHYSTESVAQVCKFVHRQLADQNMRWDSRNSPREKKKGNLWRRSKVFEYELRWIGFFVREAEGWGTLNAKEAKKRESDVVPGELGLEPDRADVLTLWFMWMRKRRAGLVAPEEADSADEWEDEEFEEEEEDEVKEEAQEDVKEVVKDEGKN